jgi:hypothetical protein
MSDQPTKRRGMGVVKKRKGSTVWWLVYYAHGKRVRESSHTHNYGYAIKLLKKRVAAVEYGELVGP